MSSILKALRKLEEEKRGGKLQAPDLRVDQGQSTTARKSLLPLIVGVVLGALIVGPIFFWPIGTPQKPDVVRSDPSKTASPVTVPPAASQPVVTDPPPAPETVRKVQVTSVFDKPEAPVAPRVAKPVLPADSEPVVSKGDHVIPAPAVIAEPVSPVKVAVRQEVPPEPEALPDGINLLVSEIFYQDAVNSMAVVNDLPVMVGSHVDSAVVKEISADQVLFEIDGKVFTVPVSQP